MNKRIHGARCTPRRKGPVAYRSAARARALRVGAWTLLGLIALLTGAAGWIVL